MWIAILSTIAAWFDGLVPDADPGSNPTGFPELHILFPILVMGAFILYLLKKGRSSEEDS